MPDLLAPGHLPCLPQRLDHIAQVSSQRSVDSSKSTCVVGNKPGWDTFTVRNGQCSLVIIHRRLRVSSIIYLVGLIVIVMAILSFIGLR